MNLPVIPADMLKIEETSDSAVKGKTVISILEKK